MQKWLQPFNMKKVSYIIGSNSVRAGCATMAAMQDPLPHRSDARPCDSRGWLLPADDFLRSFLFRPELAPVPESCPAELALHAGLLAAPAAAVTPALLQQVQDADARESYTLFLRFRDGLLAAGTLEAYYMGLFPRSGDGNIDIPPLFIDLLAEAILNHLLESSGDPYQVRAADMLHRSQRISIEGGQVLSGDLATLDMLNETGGVGEIGRFLAEAGATLPTLRLQVLADDNAADFFAARKSAGRHRFLLDLTHEVSSDLGHGLAFTMTRARSGLKALANVLQQWVQHFLGVAVFIKPLQKVDDEAWRWHVGLDSEASALLNDLYLGREVAAERMRRLVSLFRLDFADAREMRADVAGKPVYLGLMMNAEGVLKIKPQNLLVSLPLHASM
jgi:hypothetical protein